MSTVDRSKRGRCARCGGLLYVDDDGDSGCLLCGAREYSRAPAPFQDGEDSEPPPWRGPGAFGALAPPTEAIELLARKRRAA